MLNVTMICVGKLKEKFYIDAAEEYCKRLSRFCGLEIIEIPEYRLPDDPLDAHIKVGLEKESESILKKLPRGALTVALCPDGREMNSPEFSGYISDCAVKGSSKLCFVVGGSYGLHESIRGSADLKLSLSKMTFPHHLARVILLEQLYRAFSISSGGKYNK